MSGMDMFSSNEDLVTKTRKPYTITKQRERWTAEEHNRFLEAIKLYGRAWQKIEEHIGTKTAVQIRSHAQKFFSKLEKEAHIKGVPLGHAREIDIPPPRPKRKPSNPYPRKTSAGATNSTAVGVKDGNLLKSTSSHSNIEIQDRQNDLHDEEPSKRTMEYSEVDNCSGIPTLSQGTPCTSFTPSVGYTDLDEGMSGSDKLNNCCHHSVDEEQVKGGKQKQPEDLPLFPKEEIQCNQNYPRHIPVHVLENSSEACTPSASHGMMCPTSIIRQEEGTCRDANDFTSPTASVTIGSHSSISIQQPSTNFVPPLNALSNNQDNCNMFANPTFSNLIVSTLLQNPAAHAAATFTASLWPFTSVEPPADSSPGTSEGFQLRNEGPSPSPSTIAAVTVMAASAWWAAHGLLPFCPPLHAGFTRIAAPVTPSPSDVNLLLVGMEKDDRPAASPLEGQQLDPGLSNALEQKHSVPLLPLLDCNEKARAKSGNAESDAQVQEQKYVSITKFESDKGKSKELVDRSSCGSNTPSSSEVEIDILEKGAKENDEAKDHWTSESTNHRFKSMGNMTESWREVSQEGKLAFKALFSREVLPQSFSPPKSVGNNVQLPKSDEEGILKANGNNEGKLQLDLNSKTLPSSLDWRETENNELPSIDRNEKEMLLMGCGHGKLKTRRTGFKPYKRCSIEAKEGRVMQESDKVEERDPKRVCLQRESST